MQRLTTFDRFLNENAQAGNDAGKLMLDLLYVRDQAHIFHWQTESYARHQALGRFYDDYIELVDDVAEQIFGKMGRFYLQDRGVITFIDYSEQNLMDYLDHTEAIFRSEIKLVVPEEGNGEIYNKIEEVLSLIDKLRYLLTLG